MIDRKLRRLSPKLVSALGVLLALCACASNSHATGAATAVVSKGAHHDVKLTLALGSSFDQDAFRKSSTCEEPSTDYSPALSFNSSDRAVSLALVMTDDTIGKVHWIQTGIPGTSTGVAEHTLTDGAKEWPNDFNEASYDGPCPPANSQHRYAIALYALGSEIDLGAAKTPKEAVSMLRSASLSHAVVFATFRSL